jgi:hypothetical protein
MTWTAVVERARPRLQMRTFTTVKSHCQEVRVTGALR